MPIGPLKYNNLRLWLVLGTVLLVGAITLQKAIFLASPRTDFTVYTGAAQAVLDGADIYGIQNVRGWRYVYPPLFSIVMVPLAKIPLWAAVIAWYLMSVAAVFHSIRMCVAMTRHRLSTHRETMILHYMPLLIVIGLLLDGIARGQASLLLMWLVIAGIYFERRGAWLRGAACLAGAVLLKVFPLTLLGYFVWKRKWRFTAVTLALTGVGVFIIPALVFGWRGNLALLNEWVAVIGKPALSIGSAGSPVFEQLLDPAKLRNQSFEAVFSRILPLANAQLLAVTAGALMAVVMLVAYRKADTTLLLSATLCWMLFISPVAENHYFVLLLLPVTSLVVLRQHRLAWTALVIFFISITARDCIDSAKFYGALCWGTLWLWLSCMIFSLRGIETADDSPA